MECPLTNCWHPDKWSTGRFLSPLFTSTIQSCLDFYHYLFFCEIFDGWYNCISYTYHLSGTIGYSSWPWLGDATLWATCTCSILSLLRMFLNLFMRISMETHFLVETKPTLIKCIFITLIFNVVFDGFFYYSLRNIC